mmetsp:Transcript_30986/g.101464  ORF Transcript_30986/g.101464 Transcript_30986/m.101464 type:complete len:509 (+) Transcript_30986:962-2488(+)
MGLLLLLAAFFAVAAASLAVLLTYRALVISHIPKQWGNPIITLLFGSFGDGTIPDIFTRHRYLVELQRKFGAICCLLQPLCKPVIFIHPERGEPLPSWWSTAKTFRGPFGDRSFGVPHSLLGLPAGREWASHRKIVALLFSRRSLEGCMGAIHASTEELAKLCEAGGVLDLYPLLHAWSLDVIGRCAFGHEFGALAATAGGEACAFTAAAALLNDGMVKHQVLGPLAHLLGWLPAWARPRYWRRVEEARRLYAGTAEAIVGRIRCGGEASGPVVSSFCATLSRATWSVEEVVDEVVGLLLAGHETSSNTACWALHLLATSQPQQERCRAEVDRAFESAEAKSEAAGTSSSPPRLSLGELEASCPLLLGCVYEALRLFPTVPTTPHIAPRGAQLHGLPIPEGCPVSPNKVALGLDPNLFSHPYAFDPERYARGEHGPHGAALATFGAGPRICVGLRLAETELCALLALLLRRFEIEPAGPAPREWCAVTNSPRQSGLSLRLVPREWGKG